MKSKFLNKRLVLLFAVLILLASTAVLLCYIAKNQSTIYKLDPYTQQYLQEVKTEGKEITIEVFLQSNLKDKYSLSLRSFFSGVENTASNIAVQYSFLGEKNHSPHLLISYEDKELKVDASKYIEYNFVKSLKKLRQKQALDIAFIEGHGEIEQVYLLDAEAVLSENYNVHRGRIDLQLGVLDNFAAIIFAGPQAKFSEAEKLIIDQYIMQGGKVLWLVDGVFLSHEDLKQQGWSASIPNRVNLGDMLHAYGVVVKPQLVQDKYNVPIPLISSITGKFISLPNPYSPRITSFDENNFIVKDLTSVHLDFASPVYALKDNGNVKKETFLSSSAHSRLVNVPEKIEFNTQDLIFDTNAIPLALALEGKFNSFYQSDKLPADIDRHTKEIKRVSIPTKMIVVGSSRLFVNRFKGKEGDTEILPIGYDRHRNETTSSNRELLANMIDWMVEDNELIALKMKDKSSMDN